MELSLQLVQARLGPNITVAEVLANVDNDSFVMPVIYRMHRFAKDVCLLACRYNQIELLRQVIRHVHRGNMWNDYIKLAVMHNNTEMIDLLVGAEATVLGEEWSKKKVFRGTAYSIGVEILNMASQATRDWLTTQGVDIKAKKLKVNQQDMRRVIFEDNLELYLSAPREFKVQWQPLEAWSI